MNLELLKEFNVDEKLIEKFINNLLVWNEKLNLTTITNIDEIIIKHIYDSLLITKVFDFKNKVVLDVGSGGGFPGIPLAIKYPKSKFVLLDSTNKKINYLNETIKNLGLKNVSTLCCRVEEIKEIEKYDVIISRALASLPIYLELVTKLVKINGNIIALKGANGENELLESSNAIKKLSLKLINTQKEKLPIINQERINFIFEKEKKTISIYPRLYKDIKKNHL